MVVKKLVAAGVAVAAIASAVMYAKKKAEQSCMGTRPRARKPPRRQANPVRADLGDGAKTLQDVVGSVATAEGQLQVHFVERGQAYGESAESERVVDLKLALQPAADVPTVHLNTTPVTQWGVNFGGTLVVQHKSSEIIVRTWPIVPTVVGRCTCQGCELMTQLEQLATLTPVSALAPLVHAHRRLSLAFKLRHCSAEARSVTSPRFRKPSRPSFPGIMVGIPCFDG